MGKNKLKKFAEMETFSNVFQCSIGQLNTEGKFELHDNPSVLEMRGQWHTRFFKNNNPIVLELGCGHGDYTVGLAQQNPDKNFIGIDIKGARMWQGAKQAIEQGLTNVAFLRTNIEVIGKFFAPNEVTEIWITFPDPQMKKATKRLTSTHFMKRYEEVMQEGGIIHLKTDSPFLSTYTKEMLRLNGYEVIAASDDLYGGMENGEMRNENGEWREAKMLQTHYEKQWLDRGLTIKYYAWRLTRKTNLVEPEIEIEKDSYRSYGRNYVSPTNH
ncbi:MAG: tRNA (guanosine(46)-N7)-methyltransferase TrmB [Paludibacteraceae bacterium]|nr:tRNA (guanosine(46)-N7)-methyltransferase TrmB [Paludibacteraceae bacterium]